MPIISLSKGPSSLFSLVTAVAATTLLWSLKPALAVSVNDVLNNPKNPLAIELEQQPSRQDAINSGLKDPQNPLAIEFKQQPSRQDAINSALYLAEHRLKQGAWQEAAQQAERVLAEDKENSKAHAILGLITALAGQQEAAEKELALLQGKTAAGLYPELITAVINGQKRNYQEAQAQLAVVLQKEPDHPIALYYSGSLELAQGRLEQAEKAFLATLRSSPDFPPALAGLGQVYWQGKQTEKAVASYQKAIAAEPDTLLYRQQLIAIYKATGQKEAENKASVEMLYFVPGVKERSIEQGLELLNRGAYDEAIKLADSLLAIYKKFPAGNYIKAVALVNKGDGDAARATINSLLVEGGKVAKTHHEAGLCYLALGDLDKAEEQFKLVIAIDPDNSRSFVFLPIIEQLRGQRNRALNGLSVMLSQKESPALIHFLRANNYLADGKTNEYKQEMEKGQALVPGMQQGAVDAVPGSKGAVGVAENLNLMVLFYFNGWYEQAVRKSALILKANPTDLFALWYNGLARMAQKQYPAAISSLKKLAQLDPKLVAVHMQLGQAFALMHDNGNALQAFQKAAEIAPSHAPAYSAMGDMYHQSGQEAEAVQSYRKAIAINPKSLQSYPPLALLLAEKPENIADALKCAEKAVEVAPNDPASLDALGWVYIQQGQWKAGIEKLQKALELSPRVPIVMYHLGVGFYKDNQPEQTKQWLQAALAINKDFPGNTQAQEILKKISQK